jgi:hypothetical protein
MKNVAKSVMIGNVSIRDESELLKFPNTTLQNPAEAGCLRQKPKGQKWKNIEQNTWSSKIFQLYRKKLLLLLIKGHVWKHCWVQCISGS